VGAIPHQIEWALDHLPDARHLKLYNSGSFFDDQAIPVEDYPRIASLVGKFETVIVESHPRLINEKCLNFRDMLKPELHVALGLETVNREDFTHTVNFLTCHGISSRAFILLRPPFLSEPEGIRWAEKSLDFAFGIGIECCTVIPVRPGNGAMDQLMDRKLFSPPKIHSLETVLEYGIKLKAGRVFADVWDIGLFSTCNECVDQRTNRLIEMNLNQTIPDPILCTCEP
jgi:radical SAM enzyme (TIGR01210 family)